MARQQPKKYIQKIKLVDENNGKPRRRSYGRTIMNSEPKFPRPLEYDDIDKEMFKFAESIEMVIDGKIAPTFTLYSNQRFSEYSQTWEHTNKEGNLYLNFKTINRDKNPDFGKNQGSLWKIPGNRKYLMSVREVLDDNGTESYETYSMEQPYTVDLLYTISFVTTRLENINKFNEKINELFSARQCYIRPNGHYLPMTIEQINDETSYSIENRKFYVQSITIRVMAYIITKDSFEVKRFPKNLDIIEEGDKFRKIIVDIEDYENKTMGLNIHFGEYSDKAEFTIDCDMNVEQIEMKNVRNLRVNVNDIPYYTQKGFKLHENDNVKVLVKKIDSIKEANVRLVGYDPNTFIDKNDVISHEDIEVV